MPSITIGRVHLRPDGADRCAPLAPWPGGVALALVMIPLIMRTTEEMLRLVPQSIREAALALGAPVWRTVLALCAARGPAGRHHGHPAGDGPRRRGNRPAAVHRAGQHQWSFSLDQPMAALTLQVYFGAQSAYEVQKQQAWAGALVLVAHGVHHQRAWLASRRGWAHATKRVGW